MNTIAEPMISWLEQSKTCTESSQRHRVQQQDHSLIRLMVAMEEDSEDEDVEEALDMEEALHEDKASAEARVLVVVTAQLLVITTEL